MLPVAVTKRSARLVASSMSDLIALHRGLERADRINLSHDNTSAAVASLSRRALADIAKAGDEAFLPRP